MKWDRIVIYESKVSPHETLKLSKLLILAMNPLGEMVVMKVEEMRERMVGMRMVVREEVEIRKSSNE